MDFKWSNRKPPVTMEEVARLVIEGMLEGAGQGLQNAWKLAQSRIGEAGIQVNEEYFEPASSEDGPRVHRPRDQTWKW